MTIDEKGDSLLNYELSKMNEIIIPTFDYEHIEKCVCLYFDNKLYKMNENEDIKKMIEIFSNLSDLNLKKNENKSLLDYLKEEKINLKLIGIADVWYFNKI